MAKTGRAGTFREPSFEPTGEGFPAERDGIYEGLVGPAVSPPTMIRGTESPCCASGDEVGVPARIVVRCLVARDLGRITGYYSQEPRFRQPERVGNDANEQIFPSVEEQELETAIAPDVLDVVVNKVVGVGEDPRCHGYRDRRRFTCDGPDEPPCRG